MRIGKHYYMIGMNSMLTDGLGFQKTGQVQADAKPHGLGLLYSYITRYFILQI